MTSEDILTEILIEVHKEGDFERVIAEVNKLRKTHINSTQLELFEKAIKQLVEKRALITFNNLDLLRSPNPKAENTIAFNSTMNEYSEFANARKNFGNHNSIKNGKGTDSVFGSITKMLDSAKTDNFSRFSDKQTITELKLNEYVNSPKLFDEKLTELQNKFALLVNLNSK